MKQKAFLGTAIAAALLLGANVASACAISAWSSANGIVAADAGEPSAGGLPLNSSRFGRYSARCGLRVANNSQARFVQDNTPQNETSYRVRFYYFTGDISGQTDIFRARNGSGNSVLRVTHDGATLTVGIAGTATTDSLTVNDNRWYMVTLDWSQTGVTGRIRGSGARPCTAPATSCANNEEIVIAQATTEQIQDAQLGVLAASGVTFNNSSAVFFDEFDSRRTTTPPRLRRGDANNDGVTNALDGTGVLAEFNGVNIRPGQPDANEDGVINALDGTAILAIFNNPVPDQ